MVIVVLLTQNNHSDLRQEPQRVIYMECLKFRKFIQLQHLVVETTPSFPKLFHITVFIYIHTVYDLSLR